MHVAVPPERFVVAMTGGIAAGKSTVAEAFAARGIAVHDADLAARAVVEPGEPALLEILTAFGAAILGTGGRLDRQRLRERIFADAEARHRLEAIVHPRVHDWLRARVAADTGPYCMLAIPLLIETWPEYAWVDRVLLVDVPAAVQLDRLCVRDGVTLELARRMLAAQADPARRRAYADDVLDNTGPLDTLDARIEVLHRRYLELATAKRQRVPDPHAGG